MNCNNHVPTITEKVCRTKPFWNDGNARQVIAIGYAKSRQRNNRISAVVTDAVSASDDTAESTGAGVNTWLNVCNDVCSVDSFVVSVHTALSSVSDESNVVIILLFFFVAFFCGSLFGVFGYWDSIASVMFVMFWLPSFLPAGFSR